MDRRTPGFFMMLWHKAWLESRLRLLLGAGVIGAACAVAVLFHTPIRAALATSTPRLNTDAAYMYRIVYQGFVRLAFMMLAFILGLGGLLRERDLGTSTFTLALPVTRLRLLAVRAAVGLLELAALAILPAIVIVALSPIAHIQYPVSQTLRFAVLWLAAGSTLFAAAFLCSSLMGGEYTAFVVAWIAFFGHTVTTQYIRIRHPELSAYLFTVQEVMSGFRMAYFDASARVLVGPFPLPIVATVSAVSALMISTAVAYTNRRDF
jgi:ABC-2 type transport system permease protein